MKKIRQFIFRKESWYFLKCVWQLIFNVISFFFTVFFITATLAFLIEKKDSSGFEWIPSFIGSGKVTSKIFFNMYICVFACMLVCGFIRKLVIKVVSAPPKENVVIKVKEKEK